MAIWFEGPVDVGSLARLGEGNLIGLLGIRFTAVGDDWLEASMPVSPRLHQPYGVLHGGASVVLAETVASVAGGLAVDRRRAKIAGMEINANHLRALRDGDLVARASCEFLGRRSQVWNVRLRDAADKLICLSRVTLAVIGDASAPEAS